MKNLVSRLQWPKWSWVISIICEWLKWAKCSKTIIPHSNKTILDTQAEVDLNNILIIYLLLSIINRRKLGDSGCYCNNQIPVIKDKYGTTNHQELYHRTLWNRFHHYLSYFSVLDFLLIFTSCPFFLSNISFFFLPIADVLGGYNGTIFAYGQTSSGKTHTMEVQCLLSDSPIPVPYATCTLTHTYFFFIWNTIRPQPPSALLDISLHHCHPSVSHFPSSSVGTNLLYHSLWETSQFLFKSKDLPLIHPSVCIYHTPAHLFSSHLCLVAGKPSQSPGNGNHSPDRSGHFWTYICYGWEPRIPYKGLWEISICCVCSCVHVCSCHPHRDAQFHTVTHSVGIRLEPLM